MLTLNELSLFAQKLHCTVTALYRVTTGFITTQWIQNLSKPHGPIMGYIVTLG